MKEIQRSVHPRNWPPEVCPGREMSNTCDPWKGGGKLKKKRERLAQRRLANAQTLSKLPPKMPPEAFKTPGSMK